MYGIFGALLAIAGGAFAWQNARVKRASFYATEVYNLTARGHRRFALASGIFALVFIVDRLTWNVVAVPLLALYAVLAILYGASFVRGATGEDE